jgi:hypothetical protein
VDAAGVGDASGVGAFGDRHFANAEILPSPRFPIPASYTPGPGGEGGLAGIGAGERERYCGKGGNEEQTESESENFHELGMKDVSIEIDL